VIRALYVYSGEDSGDSNAIPWVLDYPQIKSCIAWSRLGVPDASSVARMRGGFSIKNPSQYDLIVSNEYYLAFGVNLRLLLTGCPAAHIIWGLNQSRRLLDIKYSERFVSWVFNRANRVVTHSAHETDLFARVHNIDRCKFRFAHWGYDLPHISETIFSQPRSAPYVCLIGRNNRDIETFCKGLAGTGVRGIIIASGIPDNLLTSIQEFDVEVHQDLDLNACLDCIRNALANVVLVKNDERGAGHITVVSGMLLGKPHIMTRARVLADYCEHNVHGLTVEMHSVDSFRKAVQHLLAHPDVRSNMGRAAREFAIANLTNTAVANRFYNIASELVPLSEKPKSIRFRSLP
jgi:glycosyltransferase involved in cell wall biosynthesis